jgi:hypothetical protein
MQATLEHFPADRNRCPMPPVHGLHGCGCPQRPPREHPVVADIFGARRYAPLLGVIEQGSANSLWYWHSVRFSWLERQRQAEHADRHLDVVVAAGDPAV